MKTYLEKIKLLKSETMIKKKRISDSSIVEIQKEVNKLKELIDNEVNRRGENLNKQEMLGG